MSKGSVTFTEDNEYYTPKYVVDFFGSFDYDPATVSEKAQEFGIEHFDTKETDGLLSDWTQYKRIWINPPFTIKHKFFEKARKTYDKVKNDIYILFPIEFIVTKRFQAFATGLLYVPSGRIKFESGLGKKATSPAFGSVIFKFGETNQIEFINLNPQGVLL